MEKKKIKTEGLSSFSKAKYKLLVDLGSSLTPSITVNTQISATISVFWVIQQHRTRNGQNIIPSGLKYLTLPKHLTGFSAGPVKELELQRRKIRKRKSIWMSCFIKNCPFLLIIFYIISTQVTDLEIGSITNDKIVPIIIFQCYQNVFVSFNTSLESDLIK